MDRIKIFIVLTASFLAVLLNCVNDKPKEVNSPEKQETHIQQPEIQYWQNEISLNQGEKWIANEETTLGIQNMLTLIEDSSPSTPKEYRELGAALNEEKNLLLKRCTMKGPPHDNLHIYLQPLLTWIAALQEADSSEKAREQLSFIKAHLEEYKNYFK